ncbi:PTS sugar transporter subunit IIC [Spiroplasma endosymbiont of Labia minor]|uniref:PTS sugar transporter subunit IIC n=1 Tax=Spiroplasma endosymbiont of Labia minor TaxID=3066305 RepID=UPI0030CAB9B8
MKVEKETISEKKFKPNRVKTYKEPSKWKQKFLDATIRVGSSIGNNRFLVAIRDAFMLPFTLTTGAAIPLILSNVFFAQNSVLTGFFPSIKDTEGMKWVNMLFGAPMADVFWAVMAGFSIYISLRMGYFLAKSYGKDGIISAELCVAVLFAFKPLESINATVVSITGSDEPAVGTQIQIATNYLGNSGMLVALLSSMLTAYIYCKLMDVKWLVPKMPKSVPPMVAKAFAAIFVASIVLMSFAFINPVWYIIATQAGITGIQTSSSAGDDGSNIVVTEYKKTLSTIFVAIEFILAKPLMGLSGNVGATILISFLVAFFWFFRIHGTNILTPITSIIWDVNVLRNTAYYIEWKNLHATNPDLYHNYWSDVISIQGIDQHGLMPIPMAGLGYVGGTGATLGFLIGILISSRSKVHREIAKLSIVPGVFGINEPVNFGVPIVLTPVYFIPYVFGFYLVYTMGHVWILIHWIRPGVVWTPTMPYGLNVLFATDFDWWLILVSIIQLGLSFAIWFPFVFIGPKYQEKIENARIEKEKLELEKNRGQKC